MSKRITKKDFEKYLNENGEGITVCNSGRTIKNVGSYMRRTDPIQFEVGYNEYVWENSKGNRFRMF
jgi:hypothetical protein